MPPTLVSSQPSTFPPTENARAVAALASAILPSVHSGGRQRTMQRVANRVRRDGKFFRLGDEKFYVKGLTYGPFAPNKEGICLPDPEQAGKDFELIGELGAN
ncbi:MAG TPA: hypothetical protein VFC46_00720, partial [Humisphaera sp.]|nr:hypothetical protein [Humisphaera sp.]